MSHHQNARAVYERPRIETYGTLREITAQLEQALPAGMGVAAASSVPTGPPPGGPETPERTPPGPGPEGNPPSGFGGEETFGGFGGGGESGVGGAEQGGGGGGAGGGGGGAGGGPVSGGAAELPFTGFPAAVAAAVGAGLASAGTALRRVLKRR